MKNAKQHLTSIALPLAIPFVGYPPWRALGDYQGVAGAEPCAGAAVTLAHDAPTDDGIMQSCHPFGVC